ncbi:MAG: formylglycine-generating enzyme family protein [bacterium]|nr:formylglycine-generating enzyme family protein [bacterium]
MAEETKVGSLMVETSQLDRFVAHFAPDEIFISPAFPIYIPGVGTQYTFEMMWSGSWRLDDSWDAAWIFLKIKQSDGSWKSVPLSTDPAHHQVPEGAVAVPSEDGAGVFLHWGPDAKAGEQSMGAVTVNWRVRLTTPGDTMASEAEFVALRMVRVPEGPFWAGDPKTKVTGAFHDADSVDRKQSNTAFLVESEDAIEVVRQPAEGRGRKCLNYSRRGGDCLGPVPADFPKGHQPFYMMRSQLTQGQFADFINALVGDQKTLRYPYVDGAFRFAIHWEQGGFRVATRPRRACNFLSWADGAAYAAWAGLRPMTELEYEKACRGVAVDDQVPESGAYAWGNTRLYRGGVIQGMGGMGGEVLLVGNCNVDNLGRDFFGGDGGSGPVKDDFFMASGFKFSPISHFQTMLGTLGFPSTVTGASATGIMALSGNLWESCVSLAHPEGRKFTGTHGTGELTQGGEAPASLGWPANQGGFGFRGGSWITLTSEARVANRRSASGLDGRYLFRSPDTGFRCVRTAPAADR